MDEISEQAVKAMVDKVRSATPTREDFVHTLNRPISNALSPWEFWALLGFLRHERRQKWVGYIVETKLKGSGRELGTSGALAHPEELEQSDDVPDMPGWKYFFHGCGCCLTNADGTNIDVDFANDGSPLEIDPYFYSNFLSSVPHPDWSDLQLRPPKPLQDAW